MSSYNPSMPILTIPEIIRLGKRMSLRQQALATAQIYVRRFYTQIEIRKTNPYLVMATAIYLACKVEECPVHIKLILAESQRQWPNLEAVSDVSKIGECEFYIISTLKSRLVLHHPYRTLVDHGPMIPMLHEETALAWSIINDHYNTDLPLLYPPHVIAFAAIFLAVTLRPVAQAKLPSSIVMGGPATSAASLQQATIFQGLSAMTTKGSRNEQIKINRLVEFFAESDIDLEAVIVVTQELISLYEVWELYSERPCREAFARILRENPGSDMMN